MTEEKHTSRKTRVNPLIVFLQKGLYKGTRRDGELALASGSPVSLGSRSFWGERRPSASSDWSSSFTSWTRPLRGRNTDSSCQQRTSILDQEEEKGRRSLASLECRTRDSSADTQRDIEDIEDFELDCEDEDVICDSGADAGQEETERESGTVSSPDLAYCSMEGRGLSHQQSC